ncbi:hypothetical protein OIU76_017099 [Salix suchowensis]|nr:hypothetical protein OIU76_017099 [Salix suchowensis]
MGTTLIAAVYNARGVGFFRYFERSCFYQDDIVLRRGKHGIKGDDDDDDDVLLNEYEPLDQRVLSAFILPCTLRLVFVVARASFCHA